MRVSITYKLTIALVGLTLLVVTATLSLARWSFNRGFLEYINTQEQQRLNGVRQTLADDYVAAGNTWDTLDTRRLNAQLRTTPFDVLADTRLDRKAESRPNARPGARADEGRSNRSERGEARPPPGRGRPPRGGRERIPLPPTALYDQQGRQVAGQNLNFAGDNVIRVPIVVDGETVGELRTAPRRELASPEETEFSKRQLQAIWFIGSAALLIALAISLVLANGLLAPIRRMGDAVDQLSSGNYDIRLSEVRADELGTLMRDVDQLAETLEHTRASRRRWLADVSHELRTPLTVLHGELEALNDGVRPFNATTLASFGQEIQRMRYLVDDLYQLSVSDVGGLQYAFAPLDFSASVERVVSGVTARASETGIVVDAHIASDLWIRADARRIDQLLHNIFENALAYTDAPGRIRVSLNAVATQAVLDIEDTAPGVPAEDCERLFEPLFRRESSRSRRTGGAGLGLAICRRVVEAHGGTIVASQSALGGLCLRVELALESTS
ncbi:MAG: ATP-binding protein [Pseudomonadota bacterium]